MYNLIKNIIDKLDRINIVQLSLLSCTILIYFLTIRHGIIPAILFASIPLLLLIILLYLKNPLYYLFGLFIVNYFIMGVTRYYPLKAGIIMSILCLGLLFLLLIQNLWQHSDWKRSKNLLTWLWSCWFVYCLLELFNPMALFYPWAIAFPFYAMYPLLIAILIPVLFTRYRHFEWLLILWGVLTILAAARGYWQRNRGFDPYELNWLYNENGASTHFIYSGIRFFSFFTDAANFGCSMGLSLVVFGISSFYVKKYTLKIFFWITAIAAGYGLLISGTRSAIAVPLAGLLAFLFFCKNLKAAFITGIVGLSIFSLLNYTKIGDDNRLIKRIRTAFNSEDPSMLVRTYNKRKIWNYMLDKPFGVGLGLSGGKAKRFKPYATISKIPTDSHLVMTWVETGMVGLIIYLTILGAILYKGSRIVAKEIKNTKLQGILFAILSGIIGLFIASYANEVIASYPNGVIVFILLALVYTSPYFEKDLVIHE